jgi:uncharacterized protein (TIGR00369 family)
VARTFARSPIHRLLGFELQERDSTGAVLRLPLQHDFLQEEGLVQGGVIAALADATAVQVLLPELAPERSLTSIEFKLNFLRPARLAGGALVARAELVRRGRSIALCKVLVEQAGQAIATGLFTYLLQERD